MGAPLVGIRTRKTSNSALSSVLSPPLPLTPSPALSKDNRKTLASPSEDPSRLLGVVPVVTSAGTKMRKICNSALCSAPSPPLPSTPSLVPSTRVNKTLDSPLEEASLLLGVVLVAPLVGINDLHDPTCEVA